MKYLLILFALLMAYSAIAQRDTLYEQHWEGDSAVIDSSVYWIKVYNPALKNHKSFRIDTLPKGLSIWDSLHMASERLDSLVKSFLKMPIYNEGYGEGYGGVTALLIGSPNYDTTPEKVGIMNYSFTDKKKRKPSLREIESAIFEVERIKALIGPGAYDLKDTEGIRGILDDEYKRLHKMKKP